MKALPTVAAVVLVVSSTLTACGGRELSSPTAPSAMPTDAPPATPGSTPTGPPETMDVSWRFDGQNWTSTGAPPACPAPLRFITPVDLSRVTSILYPGQSRGADYKPHGGFRLDEPGETGVVNIVAPMDAMITRASRYLVGGTVQYLFEFLNDCGIMYRFDHLVGLSPTLQTVASRLPPPTEGDSRTTEAPPGLTVRAGDVVSASVGLPAAGNIFFDWGVYDLRQRNSPGQSAAWSAAHPGEFAAWAICWLDHLSPGDSMTVRNLPGTGASGSMSDYCL